MIHDSVINVKGAYGNVQNILISLWVILQPNYGPQPETRRTTG